jgi:hypothetical protein
VASLLVTLAVDARRVLVSWRLADVAFDEGDPLGKLPLSIAGAPTLQLGGEAVAATGELGPVPLVMNLTEDDDGDQLRTDAPTSYIDGQLRGIVGLELTVTKVEGKAKLSQNRSLADREGVVTGLRQSSRPGEQEVADQMAATLDDN